VYWFAYPRHWTIVGAFKYFSDRTVWVVGGAVRSGQFSVNKWMHGMQKMVWLHMDILIACLPYEYFNPCFSLKLNTLIFKVFESGSKLFLPLPFDAGALFPSTSGEWREAPCVSGPLHAALPPILQSCMPSKWRVFWGDMSPQSGSKVKPQMIVMAILHARVHKTEQ